MTSRPLPQCAVCAHLRPHETESRTCSAFPEAIPETILANRTDHREPYEGDNGVRWEPLGGAAFPEWAMLGEE